MTDHYHPDDCYTDDSGAYECYFWQSHSDGCYSYHSLTNA